MIIIKFIVGIIAALFFIYWAIRIVAVILAIINIHDGFPEGEIERLSPEEYEEIKDEMKKRGFGKKRLEELRRERMKKKEQQ